MEQGQISVTNYIYFDLDRRPLDDLRVRKALALAIDHDALAAVAFPGGVPAAGLVPPALWGYDPSLHPYPHDPDAARRLLAEAGYPNGFSTELWAMPVSRPYVPNGRRAAAMIQADWAKIGVQARIVTYEWGEYLKRTRDGDAPIAMLGDIWDYPDPSEVMLEFVCRAPANAAHFCSPAYDAAVLRANVVTDQAERARLYQQAQRAMYDDGAAGAAGECHGVCAGAARGAGVPSAGARYAVVWRGGFGKVSKRPSLVLAVRYGVA